MDMTAPDPETVPVSRQNVFQKPDAIAPDCIHMHDPRSKRGMMHEQQGRLSCRRSTCAVELLRPFNCHRAMGLAFHARVQEENRYLVYDDNLAFPISRRLSALVLQPLPEECSVMIAGHRDPIDL
jgi:hypothetical protein